MKRVVYVGLIALLLAALATPCLAWEFKMKGEAEWRYRYWARTGPTDIFGHMDSNLVNLGINHLATFPTAATTNRTSPTFGVLAGQNNFGAEMNLTDYRMTFFPQINVNPAISLSASVNLTSLGIWSDGQPLDSSGNTNVGYVNSLYVPISDRPVAVDVPNTYVTVQWAKLSIKTPMLDFSIGYKDSSFGMGLWKHKCNRASASFGVTAHYGPLKIGFSPYFSREQSFWALGTASSRNTGPGAVQRHEDRRNYFLAAMGEVQYANGPLLIQLVSDSYRQPDAATIRGNSAVAPTYGRGDAFTGNPPRPSEDILRYRLGAAMKYTNGRLFFNTEVDWFNRWRAGRGTADPSTAPVTAATSRVRENRNDSAWLYGVELGWLCGPSKVTGTYVRATGDDPTTRFTTEDAVSGDTGVTACFMKPWGYLMYYMYGAGDGWDAAGYGQPTNFQHLGGRLDYAVAANLNVFTVYSYAWRDQPTAYRLGGNYRIGAQQWTNEDIRLSQLGTFRGHAVPDSAREIGWEVDLGTNWKLLENLQWQTTLAYWQPGTWWAFAYPNTAAIYRGRGVTAGANSNPNNTAAGETLAIIDLGRDIDPLFAVETTLLINF